jgi:hypothetical protein
MREIDALRAKLRSLGIMGSGHDRGDGGLDRQERYDAKTPQETDLLSGGDGFRWSLSDLYRQALDKRAKAVQRAHERELAERASSGAYPVDNDTWWDDLQRARQRPDLRSVVKKSIDFTENDRQKARELVGVTQSRWTEIAGRRDRRERTAGEQAQYAELGRRVNAALPELGEGAVKLLCEAYGTNRDTLARLRPAGTG